MVPCSQSLCSSGTSLSSPKILTQHLPSNPPTCPKPKFSMPIAHSLESQRVWAHSLPKPQGRRELDVVEGLQALLAAPCAEQNPPSGLCRPTALAEHVPLPQHRLSVSSTTAWHGPFACEQVPMSLVTPWHTAPSLAVQPDLYLENIWNYLALKFSISSLLKLHVCLCWRETGRLGWLVTR